ncbi:beta-1,6-N-acetylglucosaminyltransferase [Ligilactobacillus salivarius]|uniref:beta-1,6-N-acetylglucosaminyltransferase n=1 Tax=Ligilactobacillus salivarius TaxID=1624 RepID=UPI002105F293|nr:beta-1,6-N-acetylglucosaminyltransferase [Ligilactobacillus salivarius]UTX36500.1 beta-1,6-N-acetylglucosaminyltransferase [Ligilactobacillus salivarius]
MQAILILAHKNVQQVVELSRKLNSNFNVYIHFDKKMTLDDNCLKILENENIRYISQEDVKWGSWSIVRATIALMNLALSDKDNRYFHLISGQDWPIINSQEIYDFFEDKNSIYMERYSADRVKKSHEEIINWQKYYYYYDVINRRKLYGKIFHRLTMKLQGLLKINKFKKLKINLDIYAGSQWGSLPRDAVEFALDYLDSHENVYKMFETGFCSDEFWLPTILANSSKFRNRYENYNYHFIKWTEQHGSYPAILDENNFIELRQSKAFFARKFDADISRKLIEKLESE